MPRRRPSRRPFGASMALYVSRLIVGHALANPAVPKAFENSGRLVLASQSLAERDRTFQAARARDRAIARSTNRQPR